MCVCFFVWLVCFLFFGDLLKKGKKVFEKKQKNFKTLTSLSTHFVFITIISFMIITVIVIHKILTIKIVRREISRVVGT